MFYRVDYFRFQCISHGIWKIHNLSVRLMFKCLNQVNKEVPEKKIERNQPVLRVKRGYLRSSKLKTVWKLTKISYLAVECPFLAREVSCIRFLYTLKLEMRVEEHWTGLLPKLNLRWLRFPWKSCVFFKNFLTTWHC